MLRMDLRDYQLGHDNLNVFSADGIYDRDTLRRESCLGVRLDELDGFTGDD